jgi:hypothetical protein
LLDIIVFKVVIFIYLKQYMGWWWWWWWWCQDSLVKILNWLYNL